VWIKNKKTKKNRVLPVKKKKKSIDQEKMEQYKRNKDM